MPHTVAKLCPVCVYPRPLKSLRQHLTYAHKIVGRERKELLKSAKVVSNSTLQRHRSMKSKLPLLWDGENDRKNGAAIDRSGRMEVKKEKTSSSHERWLERRELEKKERKLEKVCQDTIVEIVFDLFTTEYEYVMKEEKHRPQESFEEEMLLAFDSYWTAWSEPNNIDNETVIDYDYVAQVAKVYVKRFKWCDFPEFDEDKVNRIVDEQLSSLWNKSSSKHHGLLTNTLKRKVTVKLLRDESNTLKRIYIDCVCDVFKNCEV